MSGSFARVAAITVPAGDYLLQAKTTIFSTTASSAASVVLSCRTESGATTFDDARVWAVKAGAVHGAPLPID
jgi:hypothetical protein